MYVYYYSYKSHLCTTVPKLNSTCQQVSLARHSACVIHTKPVSHKNQGEEIIINAPHLHACCISICSQAEKNFYCLLFSPVGLCNDDSVPDISQLLEQMTVAVPLCSPCLSICSDVHICSRPLDSADTRGLSDRV